MRSRKRFSPRRYSTNNMNQNYKKDTTLANESTLSIQSLDADPSYCEDFLKIYEQNHEYMKSLCPAIVRMVQTAVDEECDKLEYSGSCMFDEWPDRVELNAIIDNIYNAMKHLDKENPDLQMEELKGNPLTALESTHLRPLESCTIVPLPDYNPYGYPDWYRNLIASTLYNEMLYRRMRYYHRRYYPGYWR